MITRVYVNRHVASSNRKNGTNDPPITVKRGRKITRAHQVSFLGLAVLVHKPEKPLSCGATIWIETEAEVVID